jgi:hypothetical protein
MRTHSGAAGAGEVPLEGRAVGVGSGGGGGGVRVDSVPVARGV